MQKAVVQQDNASLRKVRNGVTGYRKSRARVDDCYDDIFEQDHEHEKCNSNQDVVDEFIVVECVP